MTTSTREEVEGKIAKLQKLLPLMTHPKQRVCLACDALYEPHRDKPKNTCYCDYESDRL